MCIVFLPPLSFGAMYVHFCLFQSCNFIHMDQLSCARGNNIRCHKLKLKSTDFRMNCLKIEIGFISVSSEFETSKERKQFYYCIT